MPTTQELREEVNDFFDGDYNITDGTVIPDVEDIALGKIGREMELAMLFIDIKESTKIVDSFRRQTAAKMYKSFLYGITKIALANGGQLRSFNGDGVLVVFVGESKCNNAAKAAMQMKYFCREILKPKVDAYMESHVGNDDIYFSFGIGIDVGTVLIVRGGIRGFSNNDLVWVGNATNYAVKLSALATDRFSIFVSSGVYKTLNGSRKVHKDEYGIEENMWEKVERDEYPFPLYKTSYYWTLG